MSGLTRRELLASTLAWLALGPDARAAAVAGRRGLLAPNARLMKDLNALWTFENSANLGQDNRSELSLTNNAGVTQVAGLAGNAAHFTRASAQFLSCASDPRLQASPTADMAYIAWVLNDTKTADRRYVSKGTAVGASTCAYITHYFQSSDRFRFSVSDGTTLASATDAIVGSPSNSTWYMLYQQMRASTKVGSFSVNNNAFVSTSALSNAWRVETDVFNIGTLGTGYHDGKMAFVPFWRRLLTSAEITFNYNSGAGVTEAAFKRYTSRDILRDTQIRTLYARGAVPSPELLARQPYIPVRERILHKSSEPGVLYTSRGVWQTHETLWAPERKFYRVERTLA